MRAISNEAVVSTLQLLRRGETRKRIALKLNLSKTFVAKVARGEIKPREGRGDSLIQERIKDLYLWGRSYHKCSECGAYVKMPCLKCHGENLDPETAAILDELYPQDKARGYKAGQVRGAFTLKKTL